MIANSAPEFRGSVAGKIALGAGILGLALCLSAPVHASEPSGSLDAWNRGAQPPFALDDLSQRNTALADHAGRIVLVHFFATWCEPCRDELPALKRLVERGEGRLTVLAISVAEPDVRVRAFVEKLPVNFPILLDRDRAVAKSWGVSALPTTFVLDGKLTPRLFVERDYDWDQFDLDAATRSLSRRPGQEKKTTFRFTLIAQGEPQ